MATYRCVTSNPESPDLTWYVNLYGNVYEWREATVETKSKKTIPVLIMTVIEKDTEIKYTANIYGNYGKALSQHLYKTRPVLIEGETRKDPTQIHLTRLEFLSC